MKTVTPKRSAAADHIVVSRRGRAFVVVDHGSAAADPAAPAGGVQAVLGLADDVAAAVLGHGEGQIDDQGA
ncbi:hypothetical protein [Actinoallomurus oryzae]|uniref:hypothetical protein n=1 Tax=Actinoallomurus oryzae TaxID=502180 RepID=UPI0031E8EEEB